MKKTIASILSLGLLLVSCSFPPLTATPLPDNPFPAWDDRSIFKSGLVESQQPILNELNGASVYHITFTIADDLYHVSGTEEVSYTNTETVLLNEIQLRLFANILGGKMDVSNITIDEKSVKPKFDLENSLLILPLSSPLGLNASIIIRMDFAVTVPQSVELNYGVLAYYENVLALAHAYPMICVYDDEGWNAEIPPQDGDVTYADTSFYLVNITAPKEVTLVTTGSEMSHNEAGQTQALSVASGPARDFYLAASSDFEKVSQTFGEVKVNSYATHTSREGAQMAMEMASRAIDVYSARYAPYPYTEFDIVATPTPALGIEYPGMIAIASRIYDVNGDYHGAPTSIYMESTVAHEVGHQWFYGLVGDDQLDDPWLDESLTQFVTLQYYIDEYGADAARGFQASLESRWSNVDRANIPIGLPVAEYHGPEYGAIVYGRGPLFFVALKDQIGEAVFEAFLKDYTETLSWGVATPEFMQSLAEKHCACDLQQIFDEWVYP